MRISRFAQHPEFCKIQKLMNGENNPSNVSTKLSDEGGGKTIPKYTCRPNGKCLKGKLSIVSFTNSKLGDMESV